MPLRTVVPATTGQQIAYLTTDPEGQAVHGWWLRRAISDRMPDDRKISTHEGIAGHAAGNAAERDVLQDEQTTSAERIGFSDVLRFTAPLSL
jgi:hypothetical protein